MVVQNIQNHGQDDNGLPCSLTILSHHSLGTEPPNGVCWSRVHGDLLAIEARELVVTSNQPSKQVDDG